VVLLVQPIPLRFSELARHTLAIVRVSATRMPLNITETIVFAMAYRSRSRIGASEVKKIA
jgi:hypothetical protein